MIVLPTNERHYIMASGNRKSVEVWNVRRPGKPSERVLITKAVVRSSGGQFLGATNYKVNLKKVVNRKVQA
jgi:hypothetical protein